MLKTITKASPELASFLETLGLPLSQPQHRHVAQVADSLITTLCVGSLYAGPSADVTEPGWGTQLSRECALSVGGLFYAAGLAADKVWDVACFPPNWRNSSRQ